MIQQIFIARQPIIDADEAIYGYELLFREFKNQQFRNDANNLTNDQLATSRVLVNTLNHFGINSLVEKYHAFINADTHFLMDETIFNIPNDRFVIEILEYVTITPTILERIKSLKAKGYRFALDDYVFHASKEAEYAPLFALIDILKLDISNIDREKAPAFIEALKPYSFKLLAEKVETREDFELYKKLGCHYFQGYFFAKPEVRNHVSLDPKHAAIVKLTRMIEDDADINTLETAFSQHPEIALQLIRFINSAAHSLKANIKSIKHAISLLGKPSLKNWLFLLAFSQSHEGNERTSPLFQLAHTRSKIMAKFADILYHNREYTSEASFVGILSLIDNIFQAPLTHILNELQLDKEIEMALLHYEGVLGKFLSLIFAIETYDIAKSAALIAELKLPDDILSIIERDCYGS
ncbi:MAG: hypothetical protein KU37_12005 [Sulfuricurvum sp. PC08-66]|nr:MAG: hypothetical protein KU37_12005 [Sulfuricurvum sp. PC08-66]